MKRITILAFILIIALSLYGCFVNKFYNEEDLINLPITGEWKQINDTVSAPSIIWSISDIGNKEYIARQQIDQQIKTFRLHFFKIDNAIFGDILLSDSKNSKDKIADPHFLCKVIFKDNKLIIPTLNEDYLDRCIRANKYHLDHTISEDYSSDIGTGTTIIYTASTAALQAFIRENADDKNLFPEEESLVLTKLQ